MKKKWNETNKQNFEKLFTALQSVTDFSSAHLNDWLHAFVKDNALQNGDIFPVLRIMLSGTKNGPAIWDIMGILEKEISLKRIQLAIPVFDKMISA